MNLNLQYLIKEVGFEGVLKELLLIDRNLGFLSEKFKSYFEFLKSIGAEFQEIFAISDDVLMMDRENYEYTHLYRENTNLKDVVAVLTAFVPAEAYLSAKIYDADLEDLTKELIVAGVLYSMTFKGTCFTEDERISDVLRIKEILKNI